MDNVGNHLMQQQQQLQGNPLLLISKQQQQQQQQTGASKHAGVPPASPYSQFFPSLEHQQMPMPSAGLHSLSRSQPALFSLESPPTTSLSDSVSADVSTDDHDAPISRSPPLPPRNPTAAAARDGLPPRMSAHRRSQCDVPFAFFPPPVHPVQAAGFLDSTKLAAAGVKAEVGQCDLGLNHDGIAGDDLFNAYMNLQGFDALTSSEENHSRDSGGSKTNAADSSENEADSNLGAINASRKKGMKRSASAAATGDSAATSRHCRSLSMDSFMCKFNFGEEPKKLQISKSNSMDGAPPNTFSLEFGNGQFTTVEMKKIMENEKLVEMAMADPKRVKRFMDFINHQKILANRQSAARSKERKMRYIAELEHKIQALRSETTTLSAQLNLMQRDTTGLLNQNNELKFRLQAMEQQAQLRDALNEALSAEVQRLKLSLAGLADASHPSDHLNHHQTPENSQMFQFQQKHRAAQMPLYPPQKQQNDNTSK